jgi:hypothetical protein
MGSLGQNRRPIFENSMLMQVSLTHLGEPIQNMPFQRHAVKDYFQVTGNFEIASTVETIGLKPQFRKRWVWASATTGY